MALNVRRKAAVRVAPPMVYKEPQDDPRLAGWLVPDHNCTPLGYEIVLRGACDNAVYEQPWRSNRGKRIDAMTVRAGYTPPQYWCGIWVGTCWIDRGAFVPEWYGSVDWWLPWMVPVTLVQIKQRVAAAGYKPDEFTKNLPGSAIVYGKKGNGTLHLDNGQPRHPDDLKAAGWDGVHIGMITRAELNEGAPDGVAVITREGNRGWGIVTDSGIAVNEAPTERHDVLGIVIPRRSPDYVAKRQIVRKFLGDNNG